MKNDAIKTTVIVIWVVAVVLGAVTFIVVFYPTGSSGPSYQPAMINSSSSLSTSTPSSTSQATTTTPAAPNNFASEYTFPYPLAWAEGYATLSITKASLTGNQLTFRLTVQTGNYECVHLNLRLIMDELGNLKAPDTQQFIFPDSGDCQGKANVSYQNQVVTFTIDPGVFSPILFTTGGASNVFFLVATTSVGGVEITLPAQLG